MAEFRVSEPMQKPGMVARTSDPRWETGSLMTQAQSVSSQVSEGTCLTGPHRWGVTGGGMHIHERGRGREREGTEGHDSSDYCGEWQ